MTSTPPAHFERLYRRDPDPWDLASSPYEDAKYGRTIAALGPRRFRRGLEIGCSIGVLTARLAERCDVLVACDGAPSAIRATRARSAGRGHAGVDVRLAVLPDEMPGGPFDLVVASEVLYYLDDIALRRTLDLVEDRLTPGGLMLAVHWTEPTRTHPQQGDDVHAAILARRAFRGVHAERHPSYRLDLLVRR